MTPAQIWALTRAKQLSDYQADRRSGIIAAVIANANRKKNSRAFKAEDFMPDYNFLTKSKQQAQTPEQMRRIMEVLATRHNIRMENSGR